MEATMQTMTIKGMHWGACQKAVVTALGSFPEVRNITVNLEKQEASWEETTPVDREAIKQAIRNIGFTPE